KKIATAASFAWTRAIAIEELPRECFVRASTAFGAGARPDHRTRSTTALVMLSAESATIEPLSSITPWSVRSTDCVNPPARTIVDGASGGGGYARTPAQASGGANALCRQRRGCGPTPAASGVGFTVQPRS